MINIDPYSTTLIGLLLLELVLLNAYTKNFLLSYIVSRAGGDSRVMVQVFTKAGFYFRSGKVDGDKITYKNPQKDEATFSAKEAKYHRCMQVLWVLVEEGSDRVITPEFEGRPGAKPVEYDNYVKRALTRPTIDTMGDKFIKYALMAIGILLLFVAWKVMNLETLLNAGTTISGGNV